MNIKTEKEQLRERRNELEQLISWQDRKAQQAKKRYDFKRNSIFSFFIATDTDMLRFLYERELNISQNLTDYLNIINDRLINCA